MKRQDIPDEIRIAVEGQVRACPEQERTKEPMNRLYAFYLYNSREYSKTRKSISTLLGTPRHVVEGWIRDLASATPEQIAAIARCRYTLFDIYQESGRKLYETSSFSRTDAEKVTMAKKEILTFLHLTGISEYCFITPDDKMYFNADGKRLICDMLMNRVKREQTDQNSTSFAAYSDIRNARFDINHKAQYDWMLDMACSNLRDLSIAYPDYSGVTEYYTEDEIRHDFWRFACLVNQDYSVLPGMSMLGKLPDRFYDESHEAILDDIITTFDPLIAAELEGVDKEKLVYAQQRWIEYLDCVSDIRKEERARIMEEIKQYPGLAEMVMKFSDLFLCVYDWDAYRRKTKSDEQKWGSSVRKNREDKMQSLNSFIETCKKNPENRTEEERVFLSLMHRAGDYCAKIRPRMSINEVIEIANTRLQKKKSTDRQKAET